MALVMTPIYTQTVGSGAPTALQFQNIPQYFTDLKVLISARDSASALGSNININFNNQSSSLFSVTRLLGSGSGIISDRFSSLNNGPTGFINSATSTSSTFSNLEIYIPNYTSSNFKSYIVDGITENNGTNVLYLALSAGLFRSTTSISSITLETGFAIEQNSTFSLYGIIRSGA